MSDLHERETDIGTRTVAENPEEAELSDAIFVPFEKGFEALKPDVKVEDVRIETAQLLAMAFNALRWSHQQVVTGYYAPSVTMARSAYECWLHGTYLNLYPARLPEWKRSEKRPRPWRMRQLVAERMEPDDEARRAELLAAMNDLYQGKKGHRFSGFSVYSHPSWESIRVLVASDDDGLRLRAGPDYDQNLFRNAFDLFCTAGLFSAALFGYLLAGAEQDAFVRELDAVKDRVRAWRLRMATL